jgi:hypothetical protein
MSGDVIRVVAWRKDLHFQLPAVITAIRTLIALLGDAGNADSEGNLPPANVQFVNSWKRAAQTLCRGPASRRRQIWKRPTKMPLPTPIHHLTRICALLLYGAL